MAISRAAAGVLAISSGAQQTPPAKKPAAPAAAAHKAPVGKSTAPLALVTTKDKFSYALGMNLGTSLHRQSVPVDPNILMRGLKDSLAGGKTRYGTASRAIGWRRFRTPRRSRSKWATARKCCSSITANSSPLMRRRRGLPSYRQRLRQRANRFFTVVLVGSIPKDSSHEPI